MCLAIEKVLSLSCVVGRTRQYYSIKRKKELLKVQRRTVFEANRLKLEQVLRRVKEGRFEDPKEIIPIYHPEEASINTDNILVWRELRLASLNVKVIEKQENQKIMNKLLNCRYLDSNDWSKLLIS